MRLIAFLVWLTGAAWAAPVFAHAVLVETVPADRAVLAQAPAQLIVRFNEPVRAVAVQILDRDGRRVAIGDIAAVDNELRIAMPQALASGAYLASYRVISADAHPVSGSFLFAVGAAPETWQEAGPPAKPPVHWPALAATNRAIFLAGVMVAMGGTLFLVLFRRGDAASWLTLRRYLWPAAAIAGVAAILAVGLQGALIAGATSLFDLETWRLGAQSTRSTASAVAVLGLILLAIAVRHAAGAVAAIAIAAIVASFALSGHAATASPRWLAVPVLLLHAMLAAYWLGSFVPLLKVLQEAPAQTLATLRRFSGVAIIVVPVLLLAGLVLALLQVPHWAGLVETNYGITLLLKIGCVLSLLTIAAYNRLVLTPRLAAGDTRATVRLRIAIGAELAVGFAILLMTAILSQATPPRSIGQASHDHEPHRVDSYAVAIVQSGRMAIIEIDPARVGTNSISLNLTDVAGEPSPALEVHATLSNGASGVAPLRRKLRALHAGRFQYVGPELAVAGRWTVQLEVLVSDFEKLTFETEIDIR